MQFFKRRKQPDNAGTNPVAGMIAGRIVRLQTALSNHANRWINRYSPRTKYVVLVLFFSVSGTMIGLSLTGNSMLPALPGGKNVMPVHIGAPSEKPASKYTSSKTDSLTTKK